MSRVTSVLSRRASQDVQAPPPSPAADRPRRAWWRDPRVVGGVAIVVVCTALGARAAAAGDESVDAWRLTRDLAPGATPTAADLEAVALSPDAASGYISTATPPQGRLTRAVSAGELLPAAALAVGEPVEVRWVTIPVEPLHAPADLAAGERVDVWSTADSLGGAVEPALVLPAALVSAVSADSVGFAGEYGVTLEIAPDAAAAVLAAVRSGAVDLVRVPVEAEGVTP